MKTATVADLRNDFKKVSAWLEIGEKVQITKRGKPYAVLSREGENGATSSPKWDSVAHRARLKRIWGDRVFSDEEVERMRRAEDGQFEQE